MVNCGEIVLWVIRVCCEMGICMVVIYLMVDEVVLYVCFVDEVLCVGFGLVIESYFNICNLIVVVELVGVDVVYLGYGFLVECFDFVVVCYKCGLNFIGFLFEYMWFMGDKV